MPLSFLQRLLEGRKRGTMEPSLSAARPDSAATEAVKSSIPLAEPPGTELTTKRKFLFAFVDLKDPFAPGEIAGEDLPGPILSILSATEFDSVFLLHTRETHEKASQTMAEIARRYPRCRVQIQLLPVSNPKDYSSLMRGVWRYGRDLLRQSDADENYICVSSGTAEMRAVWFLLTTLGMVRAKLLQVGTPANPLFGSIHVKEVRIDAADWQTIGDLALPAVYLRGETTEIMRDLPPLTVPASRGRFRRKAPETKRSGRSKGTNARVDSDGAAGSDALRSPGLTPEQIRELKARALGAKRPDLVQEETLLGEPGEVMGELDHGDSTSLEPATVASEPDKPCTSGLDDALQELGIYVGSAVLRHAAERAAIAADSHLAVLLLGETGTGKERFAELIHRLSPRFGKAMLAVNCAAIPVPLAESYLFGHVKGAFSDATSDKEGIFEGADGGTLFLDEIGELSLEVQGKLLRIIEHGIVQRLGSVSPKKVDVRIIAASNRDLQKEVSAGRFRQDLFFRLEVVQIKLPPLRDRQGEIAELALTLLKRINQRRHKPRQLTTGALKRLEQYSWPGNDRQLSNVLERSVLYARGQSIDADELLIIENGAGTDLFPALPEPAPGFSIEDFLAHARKQLFLRALAVCEGNQARAAELLGVSKQAVSKFVSGQSDN